MGARRNFCRRASPKKSAPPQQKKNCAITVLRGHGGMLSRRNFSNGAPNDTLDASQQGRI